MMSEEVEGRGDFATGFDVADLLLSKSKSLSPTSSPGLSVTKAPAVVRSPSEEARALEARQTQRRAKIGVRYKTKNCHTFAESGECKYGEACVFAHGEEELAKHIAIAEAAEAASDEVSVVVTVPPTPPPEDPSSASSKKAKTASQPAPPVVSLIASLMQHSTPPSSLPITTPAPPNPSTSSSADVASSASTFLVTSGLTMPSRPPPPTHAHPPLLLSSPSPAKKISKKRVGAKVDPSSMSAASQVPPPSTVGASPASPSDNTRFVNW